MFQHLFHLARQDGGFTFYGEPHHLTAFYYLDFGFILLVLTSSAAACILLLLLPGLRHRCATLGLSLNALWSGAAITYCLLVPEWQVGSCTLPYGTSLTYYNHANQVKTNYSLGLGIGLSTANVTLFAPGSPDIYYDETIDLGDTMMGLRSQYHEALVRGMPTPILSVYEQVASSGSDGFTWPFFIRLAGYYCAWSLKLALAVWAYGLLMHVFVPSLSGIYITTSGLITLATPALYYCIQGTAQSNMYVNGVPLVLHYGACFWTCSVTGIAATIAGIVLQIISELRPKSVHTTFSLDQWAKSQRRLKKLRFDNKFMALFS